MPPCYSGRLWEPTDAQQDALRIDFEEVMGLAGIGRVGDLIGHRDDIVDRGGEIAVDALDADVPGFVERALHAQHELILIH